MMLGSKSILTPLIPDCYVLCTLAIFKNIRNPLIFLWKMATYSYFWRVKSSKSLLQASLHRLSDLLTLVSYNKAKQLSDIKKVSGGCFFNIGFSEKSRINTCTELPVNDKMILFTDLWTMKKIVTIQNPIRKIASSMLLFCSCGYLAI